MFFFNAPHGIVNLCFLTSQIRDKRDVSHLVGVLLQRPPESIAAVRLQALDLCE